MWTLSNASHSASVEIHPDKVLYEYDGPLIFTARFAYVNAFFLKFDQIEDADLYVITQIEDKVVELIEEGHLSVLSAFDRHFYWIVEASKMMVRRYWICAQNESPLDFLPEKNVAISDRFGLVPNSLSQLNSFFSVDYQGPALSRSGIRFSLFKQLIDSTYEAARNVLSPIALLGSKSATFDFNVAEPAFNSLVISIINPTV